jgi:hypothetical protein
VEIRRGVVYHFDFGIIAPFFLTETKCRDMVVRRKTLELLGAASLREGAVDSI